jgi:hypothetical protein
MAELERFHWIAIIITVVVLILALVFIGLLMSGAGKQAAYPAVANTCPDYWLAGSTPGTCVLPGAASMKNYIDPSQLATSNTKGLIFGGSSSTVPTAINFNDAGWTTGTKTAICEKRDWCIKANVLWDGVSNYNGC